MGLFIPHERRGVGAAEVKAVKHNHGLQNAPAFSWWGEKYGITVYFEEVWVCATWTERPS